ncbi:MAG: hypothetical protein R3E31_28060 [Chloroflexota bacterium]|nr:hypothetical protein [Ardenticatenaceae bacterium]
MNPNQYQTFIDQLTATLDKDSRVLGLVALGSMAQQDYQPDQYSDHDFFVIVAPGTQSALRQDLTWLPDADQIALTFKETAHGFKVVYESGHLLEFAVFDPDELGMARTNRYRMLIDKATISARIANITATTAVQGQRETADSRHHIGQFITNLLVGVGRHRRGERLSGHKFVKINALHHLLILLAKHVPSSNSSILDNLDATRRFEFAYPELGAEIDQLLQQETAVAARGLLALAQRELDAVWPADLQAGTTIIARFLQREGT